MYEKDGKLMPGKKGISMRHDMTKKVFSLEKEVKKAIKDAEKTGDELKTPLIGNVKLTVRKFKGTVYVDIRETYNDKQGNEKPGKKGISLNVEQWNELLVEKSNILSLFNGAI